MLLPLGDVKKFSRKIACKPTAGNNALSRAERRSHITQSDSNGIRLGYLPNAHDPFGLGLSPESRYVPHIWYIIVYRGIIVYRYKASNNSSPLQGLLQSLLQGLPNPRFRPPLFGTEICLPYFNFPSLLVFSMFELFRYVKQTMTNISKGSQTKMLHVYVGSSRTDLISQKNTQMTNIAARLIWLRRKIWLCKTSTRHW